MCRSIVPYMLMNCGLLGYCDVSYLSAISVNTYCDIFHDSAINICIKNTLLSNENISDVP